MSRADEGTAAALRLWWALPVALVLVTAAVFITVVLPALANGASVPSKLIVNRSPAPAVSTSTHPVSTHPATPTSATPTSATPPPVQTITSPQPIRTTTVVVPEQPIVRESDDGRGADGSGGEVNDR